MSRRIPDDAFDRYVSLGATRSYQALADEYGVTKRAVTKRAAKENWAERLEKVEADARKQSDQKLSESISEMRSRHLTTIRAMQSRAVSALQKYPLNSGMEAMKAAEMAIKLERLVAGEPTENTAMSVEEICRREYAELMVDDEASVEERPLP